MADDKWQLDTSNQSGRNPEMDDGPIRPRVRPGKQGKRKPMVIRDDGGLEAEADAMGARGARLKPVEKPE